MSDTKFKEGEVEKIGLLNHRFFKGVRTLGLFCFFLAGVAAFTFLTSVPNVHAASRYSVATGNWNATSTWSASSGGASGASVPIAGDDVTIEGGHNVTLTAAAACATVTFTTATATSLTLAGFQLNVSGAITIPRSGASENLIAVGTGTLNAGSVAFTSGGGGVRHEITISTGTVTVSGNVTQAGSSGSASITFTGAGTLNLGGTFLDSSNGTLTTFTGSSVNYNGAGQTVGDFTYYNLTLTGSGTKISAVPGGTTGVAVNHNLAIGDGVTFSHGASDLTVTGTTTVGAGASGTLSITSTTGTKTFTGTVTILPGGTLSETTNEALSFGSDVTINGTLTENGNAVIGIAGNLTNNGTYTTSTGIHTFSGSGMTIGGTNAISIPTATFTGNYTNSGTFTSATLLTVTGGAIRLTNNGTVNATTALSGTGGVTQGTTGILNIGNASAITTLTASAVGNTVNYNRAGTQTVKPTAYHHLTLSGTSAKTMTGVTTVNGDFTLSGTASATAASSMTIGGNVSIGAGTTFNGGAGLTHNIAGNWSNSGGTFTASTSTINLNGGSSQDISGSTPTFNNLTVNNAAGVTLTATSPVVGGVLTLTSGNITTGANNVYINTTGSVSGGSTGSHVVGNLKKYIAAGATSKTFEIGDATNYTPVNIAFASVTVAGDLTTNTTAGDHPSFDTTTMDSTKSVNRYWTVANTGITFTTYDAVFNFVAGDVDAGANTSNFVVGQYTGAVWSYPTVGTTNSTNTQATGLTTFSDFQLGEAFPVGGGHTSNPPTGTSIVINSDAASTTSTAVTLTLGATGATQMVVCNDSNFIGCDWEAYDTSKSWTLTTGLGTKTVYALFKSSGGDLSSVISDTIDLVSAGGAASSGSGAQQPPAGEQPPAAQQPPAENPAGLSVGDRIKSSLSSSVYYYGSDSKRHLFPNETTYKSWYPDWSGVKTISATDLQGISLGHNVTIRPGTVLLKIETDPKVYAVEPNGLLRWVPTEARAATLYGSAWATKIVDVPMIFWVDYTFGSDITTDIHPTGTLVKYSSSSDVYYVPERREEETFLRRLHGQQLPERLCPHHSHKHLLHH